MDGEPHPEELDDEPRYRPLADIGHAELHEALGEAPLADAGFDAAAAEEDALVGGRALGRPGVDLNAENAIVSDWR